MEKVTSGLRFGWHPFHQRSEHLCGMHAKIFCLLKLSYLINVVSTLLRVYGAVKMLRRVTMSFGNVSLLKKFGRNVQQGLRCIMMSVLLLKSSYYLVSRIYRPQLLKLSLQLPGLCGKLGMHYSGINKCSNVSDLSLSSWAGA